MPLPLQMVTLYMDLPNRHTDHQVTPTELQVHHMEPPHHRTVLLVLHTVLLVPHMVLQVLHTVLLILVMEHRTPSILHQILTTPVRLMSLQSFKITGPNKIITKILSLFGMAAEITEMMLSSKLKICGNKKQSSNNNNQCNLILFICLVH